MQIRNASGYSIPVGWGQQVWLVWSNVTLVYSTSPTSGVLKEGNTHPSYTLHFHSAKSKSQYIIYTVAQQQQPMVTAQ